MSNWPIYAQLQVQVQLHYKIYQLTVKVQVLSNFGQLILLKR